MSCHANAPGHPGNASWRASCIRMLGCVLLAVLPLAGCSRLQTERDFASPRATSPLRLSSWGFYAPNRVFDALDCASAGVIGGPGLNVRLQLTDLVSFSLPMNACGVQVGLNTQWVDPIEKEDSVYLYKRFRPYGVGCYGGRTAPLPLISVNVGEFKVSPDTIGVSAHAIIVGAQVGIRPVEIVDLITGIVFIDINHDDVTWKSKKEKEEEEDE